MKHSTTNTLITAKAIYNETKNLINSGDKHSCTAGIILLQDCVELIVLAVLDELDVDENSMLTSVIGKPLNEIFLVDLVNDCPAKKHLETALAFSEKKNYLEALIEVRKAFFVSYEYEYSVYLYQNTGIAQGLAALSIQLGFGLGGIKAPYWTKNRIWINENVKKPTDYVQINHEQLKIDCMEWGLTTTEIENLRRLTPEI